MNQELIKTVMNGGVAVIKTDTIYGIVARAADKLAVARVSQLKDRRSDQSYIMLVDRPESAFGSHALLKKYETYFREEPTSMVLDADGEPDWLVRDDGTISYRVPYSNNTLIKLLSKTGPLIAPSANITGQPSAYDIQAAKEYFGDGVDLYVDSGPCSSMTAPSRLLKVNADGTFRQLR